MPDLGFRGLDNDVLDPVIVTGFHANSTHKLTPGQKEANRVLIPEPWPEPRDRATEVDRPSP